MSDRCFNCGVKRDDLVQHEGELWCPKYGDCDLVEYGRYLADDLAEGEEIRAAEARAAADYVTVVERTPFGGIRVTCE